MIKSTTRIVVSAIGLLSVLDGHADPWTITSAQSASKNSAARFEWVRMLRDANEIVAALNVVDSLRSDFPNDVDYRLARAQLLIRLQRESEALEDLAIATELAPDYEDVWRLRYSLLRSNSNPELSNQQAAIYQEVGERFPNATWWRAPSETPPHRWMVTFGAGQESLSNGQTDWNNQFIAVQGRLDEDTLYELQIGRNVRFSEDDNSLKIAVERNWSSDWFSGIAVGSTSDPRFMPETELDVHAGRTFADGWVANLRFRKRNYDAVGVDSIIGSAETYVGDFRIAYGLGFSRLTGLGSSTSHTLTGNWYYGDSANLGLTLGAGEEAEAVGRQRILRTDVSSITFSGRHPLNQRLNLNWWLGTHKQGEFYRRRYFGVAISIRI